MTIAELEALMKTSIRRLDRPKYVPHVFDERAHAIRCEENRCAEVDAYYESFGVKRTPEAVLSRRTYRDDEKHYDPKLAYND